MPEEQDQDQQKPKKAKKPANRALKSGEVWARANQAICEPTDSDNQRVDKGEYLKVRQDRVKALGDLVTPIDGEPPEEE